MERGIVIKKLLSTNILISTFLILLGFSVSLYPILFNSKVEAQLNTTAFRFRIRASNPASCRAGEVFYITADNTYKFCPAGTLTGISSITNSAGNNVIPKSNGTNLVASSITDNGTSLVTTDTLFALGGATSAFPALKRNAAEMHFRLGDDSALATFVGNDGRAVHYSAFTDAASAFGGTTANRNLILYGAGNRLGLASTTLIGWVDSGDAAGTQTIAIGRETGGRAEINNGTLGTWRDLKVRQHFVDQTITAGGTTGNQTINKAAGTINVAAGQSTIVVTNSLVTTSSLVFCTVRTNDTTALIKNCVPAAGSFTMRLNANATAETSVGFLVINQ